jgi:hypothetical protein
VRRATSSDTRDDPADFLAEASPHDPALLQDGLAALSSVLPAAAGQRHGAERLARAVSELPLRYAPFFGRLGRLWQLSEEDVRRELTRARDPRTWALTWLRGVKTFEVRSSSKARARLLCFGAGVQFPKHRHRAPESVLVLEGSYVDSTGRSVRAGDEQLMAGGSEHQLQISRDRDCIAAVSEGGIDFTGPWLRWATKLFG